MIKGFENFRVNLIEVILNNSCPLDCEYCFLENQGKAENMSVETLQNVIRMCKEIQEINPQEYISIMPSLKEPMLSWKTFQKALDTLEFDPYNYNIFFTFNTNGVLITDEIFDYCQKNLIDLHISLDGPQDIHDKYRIYRGNKSGSSWEKVMDIIKKYPNKDYLSFMTTINKEDLPRIEEIFNFMSNLPIKCWVYALNKFDDWDSATIEQLEKQIKSFINKATPQQLRKTRFQNTAAAFPNINVINGFKILQDGTVLLQPPTPNDGATKGEFTSKITLGNVNSLVEIPKIYQRRNYRSYEIVGRDCSPDCALYSFCKPDGGQTNKIYVSDFSCIRVQHFDRMAKYAKGGNMTDQEYQEIRKTFPIFNAVINVTDKCNCACPYCFTTPNSRDMDLGTMKAAIKFIIDECDKASDFHGHPGIAFFGGEPMLKYEDIIKPTLIWANESGLVDKYGLTFSMTTNGTKLTKDRLEFLKEYNCNILLSIDGDKKTQDDQRPLTKKSESSFDILDNIIPEILNYFPHTTFRSAIEPRNVECMVENYIYARKKGFRHYFITPNLFGDWSPEAIEKSVTQLACIADIMYQDISRGEIPLIWDELEAVIKNRFTPHPEPNISFNHCGIGTNSVGIATNGDLNGCQEHNTYQEHDIFYIGNIFTGIDETRHKRLLEAFRGQGHPVCKEKPELCSICNFYDECPHNYCPSHNLGTGNECTENSLVACIWKQTVSSLADLLLQRAAEENNELFKKYLENLILNPASRDYSAW